VRSETCSYHKHVPSPEDELKPPSVKPPLFDMSRRLPSRVLRTVRDGLLGIAYPQDCRVCGRAVESWDDGIACDLCWNNQECDDTLRGTICQKCSAPSVSPRVAVEEGSRCGRCDGFQFAAARAAGLYSGAIEASVLFLKSRPHVCSRLRNLIATAFATHHSLLDCDVVIPVPLHKSRRRERGFNQAAIIARGLSERFGLHMDERSVVRVKDTERHRAGLDAIDRARSVERAFEVPRSDVVKGKRILLIDDVYTTGSTLSAAATSLLAHGAARVSALTVARVQESAVRSRS
jgi:ComF family protein